MRAALSQRDSAEVILLTGYGSLDSAMEALRLGAFDYLLKPCRMPQLLERVAQAVEQRQHRLHREAEARAWRKMRATFHALDDHALNDQDSPDQPAPPAPSAPPVPPVSPAPSAESAYQQHVLQIGDLRLDTLKHTVVFREKPVHVTPTEYALLAALAAVAGQPVEFDTLMSQMREQEHHESGSRSLLAWHIGNLRKKINRHYIVSVRGVGYMLVDSQHADMLRH
jgi:DNA-binding response OmpR family regulator